jgi:phage terminase large subunit-like protein
MAILDDIQSDKRARSKKFIAETLDWIFRGLVPALREGYRLTILATYLHSKCVASLLRNGGKTQGRSYSAISFHEYPVREGGKPDGKPTWPGMFPEKRLRALKHTIGTMVFNQEYLLIPIAEDGSIFPEEWIKYYVPGEIKDKAFDAVLTRIDPASKDAKKNCKKAVITGVIAGGIVYVRAAWIRNSSVARMIDAAYRQYDEHNPYRVTYEDNGGHALLGPLFDAEAEKRKYALPIRAWTESENKIQRTEQILSADIESGRIRFLKEDPDQVILIEELVDFPNGDLDGPDCLAGLVRDLKEVARGGRFSAKGGRRRETVEMMRGYF